MGRLTGVLGILAILLSAYLFSTNRKAASAVVPAPPNGSRTKPFSGHDTSMHRRAISSGEGSAFSRAHSSASVAARTRSRLRSRSGKRARFRRCRRPRRSGWQCARRHTRTRPNERRASGRIPPQGTRNSLRRARRFESGRTGMAWHSGRVAIVSSIAPFGHARRPSAPSRARPRRAAVRNAARAMR